MPSTYTTNNGLEKPGSGEQSGTWGTTVNTNYDMLDRAINGVLTLSLSGTTSTLTTDNGSLSNGLYKVLHLTGSITATHTITIDPSDAQKLYLVNNTTGQNVTFTQGAGTTTATIDAGESGIVYADGSDECRDLSPLFPIPSSVQTALDAKANNTVTISTGGGLVVTDGDLSSNVTIKHADTSSQSSITNSGNSYIQSLNFDTYGHVTSATSATLAGGTVTIEAGTDLTDGGTFDTDQSTDKTITLNHADTSTLSGTYGSTANGTKIDQITVDARGHVTAITTGATGVGSMSSFQLEDGDGTEVTVSDGKEVKFVEGTAININWTDTSSGTNGDPYDMTFSLKTDRRHSSNSDVYTGNTQDYVFFDASVGMRFYTAGAEDMRLTDAGILHVDNDIVAFSTTISDERLKTDIQKIDSALEKVSQLNGYTFTYKDDGRASAGVIAQEVESVLPSAVVDRDAVFHGEEGETYKTVQYDQLHGLLIEAIKELKAEIEALKNAD